MRTGVCPARSLCLLNSLTSLVIEETSALHAFSTPGIWFVGCLVWLTRAPFARPFANAADRSFCISKNISSIHGIPFPRHEKGRTVRERKVLWSYHVPG